MLFAGRRSRPGNPLIIGIAGLGHNIGVTTMSIALANYLCSKRRKSTAYIEFGPAQIGSLAGKTFHMGIPKEEGNITLRAGKLKRNTKAHTQPAFFRLYDVDYYPDSAPQSLPVLYTLGYRYYVLDLGVLNSYAEAEFLRCDLKILMYDPAPWKQDLTNLLLQEMTQDKALQRTITLLGRGGLLRPSRFSSAEYSYRILDFPNLPNPFQLTPEVFEFFEKLMTGV